MAFRFGEATRRDITEPAGTIGVDLGRPALHHLDRTLESGT